VPSVSGLNIISSLLIKKIRYKTHSSPELLVHFRRYYHHQTTQELEEYALRNECMNQAYKELGALE
jgi:hypothetical protein